MVTIVIVINVLIALGCFYATWQIWKIRRTFAAVTRMLESVDRSTHQTLDGAPAAIGRGQLGIYQLRQAYLRSGPQFQRVRQALTLLGLGQSFLRRPNIAPQPLRDRLLRTPFRRGGRSSSKL